MMILENMVQGDILEYFMDYLPAYAYIKDLNGNYLYINKCLEEYLNVTNSQIKERNFTDYDFLLKEDADRITAVDRSVIESGERLEMREAVTKTGGLKAAFVGNNEIDCNQDYFYMTIKFPLKNDKGQIVGLCGLSHDITENCRIESKSHANALLKSENRFRSLFQHIQNAFALHEIVADEEGNPTDYMFLEVNDSFEEMSGFKAHNVLGKKATEVFPNIDKKQIERYGKVAQEGAVERFEQYSESLGKWYMGLAFRPQENEFATLFIDITERMQIEEALRQSEERHRTLFESMVQGVVYQDATGNIISANASAERILGLTVDQMMGRTSVDPRWKAVREDGTVWPGELHPSMIALQTGKPDLGEIMGVYHPTNETQHWINIDAVPLFKPNETKPFQVYTTFTDFTERKKVERAILLAKEKAEEADMLKTAFLANMSHEIRTPLNGIMGHIDLALSNELSEDCREENKEGLEVARESGYLLLAIINDILDLSKIEAGQMSIGIQPFLFRQMVDQTVRIGHVLIKSRKKDDIKLTHTIDDNIARCIYGDNFRIQQVVNNLVSNAVKFTEEGAVDLSVKLLPDKDMIHFCVQDTGRGLCTEQISVIFEPFRQVDFSDTRKFGGTGLGLTISKKLVDMMGGKLWVDSKIDVGSAFHFTLPYKQAPDEIVEDEKQAAEEVKQINSITSGKILIAEDDPVSRKMACKMIERAGYDVVLAENGRVAVSKFEADWSIDLILMDVNMEIMGGLEATARIRGIEANNRHQRRIPIIGLSAAAMSGDRERGAASGMTDYLTKPVNRKSLIETIERYLGRIEKRPNDKGENLDSVSLKKARLS